MFKISRALFTAALCAWFVGAANAESVVVKYRGPLDLKPFECFNIKPSSFVNRICYDEKNQYLVTQLQQTYYHYCEINKGTVDAWIAADSLGRFYNQNIKG